MTNELSDLDVFYGNLTANQAYVYARLPWPSDDQGLTLTGTVRGPRCLHAETLPAQATLLDLGPGPTLLARAVITEPCFWTPDLPAIYDVTVNLNRGKEVIATVRREIGLRSIGFRGRYLALDSKRFVLRGVTGTSTTDQLPRSWHAAAAAYITGPDEERLIEASQWGALAVVELSASPEAIVTQLKQLARCPAAAMVVVHGGLPADFKRTNVAPNVLLVQSLDDATENAIQPWAQALWISGSDGERLKQIMASSELPLFVARRLTASVPIDQARAACDELQRDLAPIGQFAGYIV
jgi:hypothetical protein